jgi:hypothetical protein
MMTTFLHPDEAIDVDFAETKRGKDRIACFLHLRDLVYLHPKAASVNVIAFVQTLEAAVIAEKASREKRLAEGRGERRPHLWGRISPTLRVTSGPRQGRRQSRVEALQEVDSGTNGCVLGLDPSQ